MALLSRHNLNKPKYVNMAGEKYGRWLVISYAGDCRWLCQCECGVSQIKCRKNLITGSARGCEACMRVDNSNFMVGQIFSKWTVLNITKPEKGKRNSTYPFFDCKCECGNVRSIRGSNLRSGRSRSCDKCCMKTRPAGEAAFNKILRWYKSNAKKRNLSWELTDSQFTDIINSNCYYTGLQPSSICKTGGGEYIYNAIDRIDNTLGYTIENSVPCNARVNVMKMEMPYSEFVDMCLSIAQHVTKKTSKQVSNNNLIAV